MIGKLVVITTIKGLN